MEDLSSWWKILYKWPVWLVRLRRHLLLNYYIRSLFWCNKKKRGRWQSSLDRHVPSAASTHVRQWQLLLHWPVQGEEYMLVLGGLSEGPWLLDCKRKSDKANISSTWACFTMPHSERTCSRLLWVLGSVGKANPLFLFVSPTFAQEKVNGSGSVLGRPRRAAFLLRNFHISWVLKQHILCWLFVFYSVLYVYTIEMPSYIHTVWLAPGWQVQFSALCGIRFWCQPTCTLLSKMVCKYWFGFGNRSEQISISALSWVYPNKHNSFVFKSPGTDCFPRSSICRVR